MPFARAIFRSFGHAKMKRVSQIHMYDLGQITRLRDMRIGDAPERAWDILVAARIALHMFVDFPENETLLPNAVERAKNLQAVVGDTVPKLLKAPGAAVSKAVVDDIRHQLAAFETSLEDDLRRLPTYYVEKIGAYSSDDLISRAESVFPEEIRSRLPQQAVEDFRMAGKCLAFDAATACGFHVFRAADAMLREYCAHFNAVPKGNSRDWGTFIRALREALGDAKATKKPNVRTVELLDSIRAQDRNPLVHPELNLDSDGAILMFDLCKNALSLMAVDIKNSP
jgi:hypothetical protein